MTVKEFEKAVAQYGLIRFYNETKQVIKATYNQAWEAQKLNKLSEFACKYRYDTTNNFGDRYIIIKLK